jgi:hypothetical protein
MDRIIQITVFDAQLGQSCTRLKIGVILHDRELNATAVLATGPNSQRRDHVSCPPEADQVMAAHPCAARAPRLLAVTFSDAWARPDVRRPPARG